MSTIINVNLLSHVNFLSRSAATICLLLKAPGTITLDAPSVDVTGTISVMGIVPIGTVLDWWCSADCTIPDGFVIADGQLISDASSPFNGENIPDLTDTFIRGVANVGNVGTTGGTSSHSHLVDPPNTSTTSAGIHTHLIDPPSTTSSTHQHLHKWGEIASDEAVDLLTVFVSFGI